MHPNHFSLPLGASHLVRSLSTSADVPRLFSLTTVPVLQKYTGLSSAFFARLALAPRALLAFPSTGVSPSIFISGIPDYLTTVRAILAHKSQMVWFRYLYMIFSRYMWVNEWTEFKTWE